MVENKESIMNVGEEKSVFERAIIEAFKQKSSKLINEKLTIALDEIKFMVSDIKKVPGQKKFLLNKNILDKFSRIIERKYFNVSILIAKIFENLLEPDNFDLLSNDPSLLINFANDVLSLLELIKYTIVSRQLEKRCSSFLSFLSMLKGLDNEQKEIIQDLIKNFPTRNSSNVYKTFNEIKDRVLQSCKHSSLDEKIDGINTLMESFGNTFSLDEQFDLLIEKVPPIVKALIHQPNPDYKDAYFQLGNFICSMLFATKFKVDAFIPEYKIHRNELNKNYFFIISGDELLDENEKQGITFIHNTVYELTSQKEILLKCENIHHICNLILNTLSIYESIFDLQFVCYIILKRIYFTYPQFRKSIEDLLAVTLINLCCFKETFEKESTEECRLFINYLLNDSNTDEELKNKIIKRVDAKKCNIDVKHEEEIKDVEFENLRLSDFNLRVGYPSSFELDAGSEMSRYIEVHQANSLVYIGFATHANDITLHLLKYVPSDELPESDISNSTYGSDEDENYTDNGHFMPVLKLDRIDSSLTPVKIVMFVREPGTYKIIWDNSFSWFTGKTLRYRLSVLKPLSEIDVERTVDFENIKNQIKKQIKENDNINKEASIHSNKLLMVKFEGKNKVYKIDNIHSKIDIIKDDNNYLIIPVLLLNKNIRIIHKDYFLGYDLEEGNTFQNLFENTLIEHFKSLNNFEEKTVFLNLFILEKINIDNSVLPITDDEFYKNIVNKLGFFPNFPKNIRLCCHNIADSCLLFNLYEKVLNVEDFKHAIHIHFDEYKAQAAIYFDGVINDKISGFNYDYSKTLFENIDNVVAFANKVSILLGEFELSISYSNIDQKLFELFAEELNKKLIELNNELPINLSIKDSDFITNVENLIELFELE